MSKKFMTSDKLKMMADVWDECNSYDEVAVKLDLSVITIKSWQKKINAKYPDKCKPYSRKTRTMDRLIDEVFAA